MPCHSAVREYHVGRRMCVRLLGLPLTIGTASAAVVVVGATVGIVAAASGGGSDGLSST
jgi:hypothetical protein